MDLLRVLLVEDEPLISMQIEDIVNDAVAVRRDRQIVRAERRRKP